MDFAKLALVGLQIVLWLMDQAKARQQFNPGQEHEIVLQSKAVMAKTALGKQIVEKIDAMSPAERDDLTDALGDNAEPGAKG